jgi:UDP-glucose 4-epimerase
MYRSGRQKESHGSAWWTCRYEKPAAIAIVGGIVPADRSAAATPAASDTLQGITVIAKRVLVTGGSGFIGSHLAEALLARGDQVTVVDDESTGNLQNLEAVRGNQRLDYVHGSVGDRELVERLTAGVDEVYHLAAAVGVALIARKPMETIERNIYPTELILSSLRRRVEAGETVKCFLASTSEVYGKNPKDTWCEDDDLVLGPTIRPRWSYGASKAIDEFMALAAWREYGLPVVIGRFFNVVGPRQTGAYGMVLPRFVDAALASKPLVVHDDGAQTRCFAHVDDVIGAVLALMAADASVGKVFNIGSDQPVSILELGQRVIEFVGSESAIEFQSYADAYDEDFEDIRRRVPDLSRLHATIRYEPQYDLEGIIRQVIDHKKNQQA